MGVGLLFFVFFFVFKQKTGYDMRISDWSSDVCSSDLDGWLATARSLVMPAFALGLVQSALIARIARSSMLDVLREQYVTTGRAKGLNERTIVYKHAFRNALVPTVTKSSRATGRATVCQCVSISGVAV